MSLEYITITKDKIRLKEYFEKRGEHFTYQQIEQIWDIMSIMLGCYNFDNNNGVPK